MLHCVVVCCSVLYCVAVCCSVLDISLVTGNPRFCISLLLMDFWQRCHKETVHYHDCNFQKRIKKRTTESKRGDAPGGGKGVFSFRFSATRKLKSSER